MSIFYTIVGLAALIIAALILFGVVHLSLATIGAIALSGYALGCFANARAY